MIAQNLDELVELVSTWKSQQKRIVCTNGVFDILHAGHVDYLQKSKELGDVLIVGMNNDASVRSLNKGPERPINGENARAFVLSALRCVDAVIIFSDHTPIKVIEAVLPDVLVKGGDYDPDVIDPSDKRYIVGSAEVKSNGGNVCVIPLVEGFSTTNIVGKIKKPG
ncbi:MAG: D-glycero-beta-D-manno-heptose 1-phosphate adenylyltransferase [Flavobacteriales bacterium]|nr:D-glycero-beta-D-manno-heptose 1-phosphate adenylyltransferase [Flavobacteriales bacterium]